MPDSLASLFPTLYAGIAEFPRRQFGMIRAVQVDGQLSRAAKGQSVVWDVPQVSGAVDIEPAATLPAPSADVAKSLTYTMAHRKGVRIAVTGEASEAIGDAAMAIRRQNQYLQAFDNLAAGIESYLAGVAILNASRAFGTADTVPFTASSTNLEYFAKLWGILAKNDRSNGELSLVLNTATAEAMRAYMGMLWKANEAGDDEMMKNGYRTRVQGFNVFESNQITQHTKGTGANYVLNGAHSAGATEITVKTGTGTILEGDVISIADEPSGSKYVVVEGITAAGTLKIGAPGLLGAAADGKAVSIHQYTPNLAFNQSALGLGCRLPEIPKEGDAAIDATSIRDPYTGLVFEVRRYAEYRQIVDEISIMYGAIVLDPEAIAIGLS
jgi:hypothetical protein